MKNLLIFLFIITSSVLNAQTKKRQIIDMESTDIQGLVDRPQTLYIIKKTETAYNYDFNKYDYVKAILEPIYKEPF